MALVDEDASGCVAPVKTEYFSDDEPDAQFVLERVWRRTKLRSFSLPHVEVEIARVGSD